LLVRENRALNDSPVIRLHVAILKSESQQPAPDPLIFLSGGPGSFSLEWLQWRVDEFQDILKERDVIFFDQRGIGYSEPFLDCPEVGEQFEAILDKNLSAAEWAPVRIAAHDACGRRLVEEGVDLSAYNSAASAADINDLRQALDYELVNLIGLSYGTRLALTTMRDFPEAVRGVILDSPVPLQIDLLADQGPLAQEALDRLFDYCAADEACAAAYPDLALALNEVLQRLDQEPLAMHVSGLTSRSLTPAKINGDFFMGGLFFSLYDAGDFYQLPKIIYDAYQEAPGYKNRLVDLVRLPMFLHQISSEGQRYAVLCGEEIPFTTMEAALAQYAGMQPHLRAFLEQDMRSEFGICEAWAGEKLLDAAPSFENEAVGSDIPTLALTGDLDPVTPPVFGELIVQSLPNGVHVEFPYASHGVLSEHRCAGQVAAAFLDDPGAELDLSCVEALHERPPEFVSR
jgi:pimeloyl-ACP methyl ester carboxylesterase